MSLVGQTVKIIDPDAVPFGSVGTVVDVELDPDLDETLYIVEIEEDVYAGLFARQLEPVGKG